LKYTKKYKSKEKKERCTILNPTIKAENMKSCWK